MAPIVRNVQKARDPTLSVQNVIYTSTKTAQLTPVNVSNHGNGKNFSNQSPGLNPSQSNGEKPQNFSNQSPDLNPSHGNGEEAQRFSNQSLGLNLSFRNGEEPQIFSNQAPGLNHSVPQTLVSSRKLEKRSNTDSWNC